MTQSELMLLAINFAVCAAGAWVCICRMSAMSGSRTKPSIRWQYAIWFSYFVASAISWTYDEPASLTQTIMSAAVLLQLGLGFHAWRYGPPSYTRRSYYEAMGD